MNEQDSQELQQIMKDIIELNQQIELLESDKNALKTQLQEGVNHYGGKVSFYGIGTAYMVKGKPRISYDAGEIDKLIATIMTDGIADQVAVAKALLALRKETKGSDYMTVKKEVVK
jgi:rhamnogalacturonyl hydrolase YesR